MNRPLEVGDEHWYYYSGSAVIRDGVAVPVLWPYGGQNLSLPSGESLQLRFQLKGKARLYSLTFK